MKILQVENVFNIPNPQNTEAAKYIVHGNSWLPGSVTPPSICEGIVQHALAQWKLKTQNLK
jgi:hypothetical protein